MNWHIVGKIQFRGRYLDFYNTIEEPYFKAVDVARFIDFSNGDTHHMLENVDSYDKVLVDRDANETTIPGNTHDGPTVRCNTLDENLIPRNRGDKIWGCHKPIWFITENGLYEILFQSRKPIARDFKNYAKRILHELRMQHNGEFDWNFVDEEFDYEQGKWRKVDIYGDFVGEVL